MVDETNNVTQLSNLIDTEDIADIENYLQEYNVVDMAEIISQLEVSEIVYLFKRLDKELLGELFSYFDLTIQNRLKDLLTSQELSDILDYVYTDDVVLFLESLDRSEVRMILSYTDEERRSLLNEMFTYPKDSAGAIMSTDYVEIGQYISVSDATEVIKEHEGSAEIMDLYYITNLDGILEGVVSVRDILFAPDLESMETIMTKEVISVNAFDHQEEVAKVLARYDLSFVPVVDDSNRFIGIVSADDIIDVVEEEATEDIHKMGGIVGIVSNYLETSAFEIAKNRIGWLLILTVVYTITSFIITGFDGLISHLPSLIIFMPLLMDTAGDAGSQSLAMVVRDITVDNIDTNYFKEVFLKELGVSFVIGLSLFVGNFLRIMYLSFYAGDMYLAFLISLTVFIVVMISKIIGGLLPLVVLYFKRDPAALASSLVTTINDSIALLIYFSLASVFLERLWL